MGALTSAALIVFLHPLREPVDGWSIGHFRLLREREVVVFEPIWNRQNRLTDVDMMLIEILAGVIASGIFYLAIPFRKARTPVSGL